MSRQVNFYGDSRKELQKGINILADAVKVTMGAKGRTVIIKKKGAIPHVTKDGVSVAREIFLKDEQQDLGAQLMKGVADKTATDCGDGTTQSTVLAQAIINEGLKLVDSGANPIDLKRGIDKAVETVVSHLNSISVPIGDISQIEQVATISANNDAILGKLIAFAMDKVTPEGTITVEESKSFETYVDVVEGLKLHKGYVSRAFITDTETGKAILDKPLILMTSNKIESVGDILAPLQHIGQLNRPVLIICSDISGEAIDTLAINKVRGGLKVCVIKAPFLGDKRITTLDDIALLTGGKVMNTELGDVFESLGADMFGSCVKVIVDKDSTIILSGNGDTASILNRVEALNKSIEECDSKYEIEEIKDRLALLSGGVAVLFVGANSEIEVKEKMDRVDDALGATRAAVAEGIVPGGGVALLSAISSLESIKTDNEDEKAGVGIIKRAILSPIKQILYNAGVESSTIISKIEGSPYGTGYDVKGDKFTDMISSGIIDPKKVTRVALENAASVASLVLMTDCTITFDE